MSQRMAVTEEDLYELLSFLVSSAHLLVNEPEHYGSFRLIDAACRLIGFALESGRLEDDGFLREFKEDADRKKLLMMTFAADRGCSCPAAGFLIPIWLESA